MINYKKLNDVIVSRETMSHIIHDPDVISVQPSCKTAFLDCHRIEHKNGNHYRVYTRGGFRFWEKTMINITARIIYVL